jgi:hypothetical protein
MQIQRGDAYCWSNCAGLLPHLFHKLRLLKYKCLFGTAIHKIAQLISLMRLQGRFCAFSIAQCKSRDTQLPADSERATYAIRWLFILLFSLIIQVKCPQRGPKSMWWCKK